MCVPGWLFAFPLSTSRTFFLQPLSPIIATSSPPEANIDSHAGSTCPPPLSCSFSPLVCRCCEPLPPLAANCATSHPSENHFVLIDVEELTSSNSTIRSALPLPHEIHIPFYNPTSCTGPSHVMYRPTLNSSCSAQWSSSSSRRVFGVSSGKSGVRVG